MKKLFTITVFLAVTAVLPAYDINFEGTYENSNKNDRPNILSGGLDKKDGNEWEGVFKTDWKGKFQIFSGTMTGDLKNGPVKGDFYLMQGTKKTRHFVYTATASNYNISGPILELKDTKEVKSGKFEMKKTDKAVSSPSDTKLAQDLPSEKAGAKTAVVEKDKNTLPMEDWRQLVKEKKVVQPKSDTGAWKFTPQTFPPIESIAAQKPDDTPLYGCFSWGEQYTQFRKEIKEVGWTVYRFSGPPNEEALVNAIEDGMPLLVTLQIGNTKQEFRKERIRDFYKSDEEFIQAYLAVLDEFCGKYGPGGSLFKKRPELAKNPVKYIEVWSEPNDHRLIANGPDKKGIDAHRQSLYAQLLKESYAFIKKKYPAITVVGFSASGRDDQRFIEKVHAADPAVANSYDIVSTHPYSDAPPMAERIQGFYSVTKAWTGIQKILAKNGSAGKPIWYSEVGWPVLQSEGGKFPEQKYHPSIPVWLAAANVIKMYTLSARLGVKKVFIISVTDAPTDDDQYNYGFFDSATREWRPSAYAAQQMIRLLPKPRIQSAISEETGGFYAYQFKCDWTKKDSKEVIIAWQEQKKGELSVAIPAGKKASKVLNLIGGEEKFSVKDGKVQFAGGPLPSYLVLE